MALFTKRIQTSYGRKIMKTGMRLMRYGAEHIKSGSDKRLNELWFSYEGVLERFLREYDIDLVLDIGANEGQFGLHLRNNLNYRGEIISFEPIPYVFNVLSSVVQDDPYWTAYNIALGKENSQMNIKVSDQSVFSSFLNTNDYCLQRFGDTSGSSHEITVPVFRLDYFLDDISLDLGSKRIFMKMDTQGYDLEVFHGLGEKCRQVLMLQSEVSVIPLYKDAPNWIESISTYEASGYGLAGLFPVNFDKGLIVEYDCVMINQRALGGNP